MSEIDMYVDWKNTGVSGWAKPKDKVDAGIESPSPDYELLPTDLWYGSGPSKIDTRYREAKAEKKAAPDTVTSRVHMAIPKDPKYAVETLVPIEVQFVSEVSGDSAGFKYRYGWKNALAEGRPPVRFRWEGLSKLFSTADTRLPETLQLSYDRSEVSFVSKDGPAYDLTLVEFLAQDGKTIVGTAPVATYHPSSMSVPQVPRYAGKQ